MKMRKMNDMPRRFTEYIIIETSDPKTILFSEDEIEPFVRKHPEQIPFLSSNVELDCKGHTYRQIMGLDELDCGVYHEFLEHPKLHFIKSLWFDFVDFLKQTKN